MRRIDELVKTPDPFFLLLFFHRLMSVSFLDSLKGQVGVIIFLTNTPVQNDDLVFQHFFPCDSTPYEMDYNY
jgi:hypothetical protein